MTKLNYKIIYLVFLFAWLSVCHAEKIASYFDIQNIEQENAHKNHLMKIIQYVENGIINNNVDFFSAYLAKRVDLNLRENVTGLFSNNQAYYILKNYFYNHRLSNFSFTKISLENGMPYATGGGSSVIKGKRVVYQVYISLSFQENKWVISQFNVY